MNKVINDRFSGLLVELTAHRRGLLPELSMAYLRKWKCFDASTGLSMTFSIDVALALSRRVWHCYSDFGMRFSQQSVFGHCHSEVAVSRWARHCHSELRRSV